MKQLYLFLLIGISEVCYGQQGQKTFDGEFTDNEFVFEYGEEKILPVVFLLDIDL